MGLAYKQERDFDEALKYFNRSLAVNKNHSLSIYGIGLIYFS